MTRAYYNEIDEYAAQWLRNLIKQGLIADGDVDTRSISDVRPVDLKGYTQCHFFAGIGGWSVALRLSGVWPDHREVWTGSCPCQPFSLAGKQGGFADKRHLWPHWRYLIEQCRIAIVFGEQVASATEWLGLVRGDLETLGYAVGAIPIQAASAGADHLRDRYWFVAHTDSDRPRAQRGNTSEVCSVSEAERQSEHSAAISRRSGSGILADANDAGSQGRRVLPECAGERVAGTDGVADADKPCEGEGRQQRSREQCGAGCDQEARAGDRRLAEADAPLEWVIGADGKARRVKSGLRLLVDGVPNRVGKLRGFGNAIDPRPAAAFIKAAHESLT